MLISGNVVARGASISVSGGGTTVNGKRIKAPPGASIFACGKDVFVNGKLYVDEDAPKPKTVERKFPGVTSIRHTQAGGEARFVADPAATEVTVTVELDEDKEPAFALKDGELVTGGPAHSTRVAAPAATALHLRVAATDLAVTGFSGHLRAASTRGNVRVREHTGGFAITSAQGNVDVHGGGEGGEVSVAQGNVRTHGFTVAATAAQGNVNTAHMPANGPAVTVEVAQGNVVAD